MPTKVARQLYQSRYVPLTQRRVQALRHRYRPNIEITPLAERMAEHHRALLAQVVAVSPPRWDLGADHDCQGWGYCNPECRGWHPCVQHQWKLDPTGQWICRACEVVYVTPEGRVYFGRGLTVMYAITAGMLLGLGVAAAGGLLP